MYKYVELTNNDFNEIVERIDVTNQVNQNAQILQNGRFDSLGLF